MKLTAVLAVAIAASTASAQQSIGTVVPVGSSTFVAGMRASKDGSNLCAGSLIHPKWILGTAGCVGATYANVGTHFFSGNADGTTVKVIRQVRHPKMYSAPTGNDYILLELETEVTNKPVAIASSDVAAGTSAMMLGWGNIGTNVLGKAGVTVLPLSDCKELISRNADMMVCGTTPVPKDTCPLDRGSPLVINKSGTEVLVGQWSWALLTDCGRPVFARTAAARDFIDKYVPEVKWV